MEQRQIPEAIQKSRENAVLKHTNFTRDLTPTERSQFFFAVELLTKMASSERCNCRDCDNIEAIKKVVLEEKTNGNPAAEWKDPDS